MKDYPNGWHERWHLRMWEIMEDLDFHFPFCQIGWTIDEHIAMPVFQHALIGEGMYETNKR